MFESLSAPATTAEFPPADYWYNAFVEKSCIG